MNTWFRFYAEFATDPKVQMLSEAMQRRYVMLLCLRCSNAHVTLHETLDANGRAAALAELDETVAFQLRISGDETAATKHILMSKGLIDECWNPVGWDKRQFVSDSSAARVARHRAQKAGAAKQASNADVTLHVTPSNSGVTPPDTDTDTDTERSPPTPPCPQTDQGGAAAESAGAVVTTGPAGDLPPATAIAVRLRRDCGMANAHSTHPDVIAIAALGISPEQAVEAVESIRAGPAPPRKLSPGYLRAVIENPANGFVAGATGQGTQRGKRIQPASKSAFVGVNGRDFARGATDPAAVDFS